MTSDSAERERALDPERSFIVEAPAGSGKTGLLTQRFLRLLGGVERCESVVAMTFTRKAAAEMRERIVSALEAADKPADELSDYERRTHDLAVAALANSRQRSWNLLDDLQQLLAFHFMVNALIAGTIASALPQAISSAPGH